MILDEMEKERYSVHLYKIKKSINQSIIYFNTLGQRAKKLVQNANVYK